MAELRRRAYLEAMGFDVWLRRPSGPEPGRLVVGPGSGSTLLVCAAPAASGGRLAADIARAIGSEPVWAWPDPKGDPGRPGVEEAVGDGLFTRLLVFGEDLARELFGAEAPRIVGSAAVAVLPDLDELAVSGSARRTLWRLIVGTSG